MDVSSLRPALESLWSAIYPEFVLAVVGAIVVVWQIRKQFTYALAQSRHNELLKLKLQLYQDIVPTAHLAQDATLDLSGFVRKFASDVGLFRKMSQTGQPWPVPSARTPQLIEKKALANRRAIDIIFFTERWEIVDPRLNLFRTAVNVALHEIDAAFTAYFSTITMMPVEVPPGHPNQGSLLPWHPPNDEAATQLEQLSDGLNDALMDLSNWLHDLQVELQNLLLGELFESRVPCRQPLDPNLVVVRLDRYEELNRYFENETNWGRNKSRIESEVRDRIAHRGQAGNSSTP